MHAEGEGVWEHQEEVARLLGEIGLGYAGHGTQGHYVVGFSTIKRH